MARLRTAERTLLEFIADGPKEANGTVDVRGQSEAALGLLAARGLIELSRGASRARLTDEGQSALAALPVREVDSAIREEAVRKIRESQALNREARSKRTEVSYTASDIGSLAARWEPSEDSDEALTRMEAALAKLNAQVAALRELRTQVGNKTWTPRPEDL